MIYLLSFSSLCSADTAIKQEVTEQTTLVARLSIEELKKSLFDEFQLSFTEYSHQLLFNGELNSFEDFN